MLIVVSLCNLILANVFLTTIHTRHRWQKIRAVQMYIEHIILPLPDYEESRKGAFRLWKVRGCMGNTPYEIHLTTNGIVLFYKFDATFACGAIIVKL